jgi:hypothetical protein
MTDNITTADKILKEAYVGKANEVYTIDCPLFAMVQKVTAEMVGKNYLRVPLIYAPSGGISVDMATAQTNGAATSLGITEFQMTRTKTYGIAYVDGELIAASETDAGAFVKGIKPYLDAAQINLMRNWEICGFREGYGVRGQLSHTQSLSSATVTLANPSDAWNFEVGQRYDVTHAVGSGASKKAYGSGAHALIVLSTDVDSGTVTFTAAINDATDGCPTIAVDDYLVLSGGIAVTRNHPCGFAGFCPDTAPGAGENFFGADRSKSPRLYGSRIDASAGMPVVEAINKAVGKLASFGGKASHVWTSFNTIETIINNLSTKVQYVDVEIGEVGFRGVRLITPKGTADVFGSVGCPDNRIYVTDMSKFGLYTLKAPIHIIDDDGLTLMRAPTSDAVELRQRAMGNFGCTDPGKGLCVIKL